VGFNDEIIDLKYAKNHQDLIIIATNSSLVKVYDSSQNKYNFLDFHSETVMCVDMVGCYLTTGSKDKSIKLFELVDRESLEFRMVASFTGHSETVSSLALAPCTQNWITSVSSDRSIKVWKVDKRAEGSNVRESERYFFRINLNCWIFFILELWLVMKKRLMSSNTRRMKS
jgi:U3 small nucleolar RNA-associated protein 13